MEQYDERLGAPARSSRPSPAAPSTELLWSRLRVWTYQAGNARELTSLFALSALNAWKHGRPPASTSFVAGTKVVSDPASVSWHGFPTEAARAAEARAPLPGAMKSTPSVPSRPLRREQLQTLRDIAGSRDGIARNRLHSLRVRSLLDRGLVEIVTVSGTSMLHASAAGRDMVRRVSALEE